ncbi:hypothetical protein O1D23_003109 [Vibrio cholerae]|uniref:HVO_A0114 family putative DNA-binding protein n=1 Tax=Vibrio mimicus TaxID=674 RepID=UPI0011DB4EAE|nr:hypothetical protein [Vibrio mimicus]EGQ9436942.1 hypothetical protein [Vibrio cholerae]EHP5029876.1 hypothetical protein [Vibrio cholerae]EKF9831595.1 hypothetical protein [Vibrio cholerae]TXY48267.1 hypothetical protein FXE78_00210 [Vibrio mimicus]GHW43373.1 hypothetical protein VCSRO56_3243 [Vibrio cholerae]
MMNQQPFESLEVLSIRRYNLLKVLAQYEAGLSIKRLASILERDYKNVHDDVAKLEGIGLIAKKARPPKSTPHTVNSPVAHL